MAIPYAEVIGDPVGHSRSPAIHKFWLEKLGIEGDYRAVRCTPLALPDHLRRRCDDPFWRGCNVTAPLKPEAARLAVDPTGLCARLGAANALFRSPLGCAVGANTDLAGVAASLDVPDSLGNQVCLIGAGAAARATLEFLRLRATMEVSLIVRDVDKARPIHAAFARSGAVYSFDDCEAAIGGAEWVINATPLGMDGRPPMPETVLNLIGETMDYALVFDMVYAPVETALLRRARELGRSTADGLTMLIAQAAPAFELFFGAKSPREHDGELRALLTS